ncbi:MAG: hypothetical protein H6734_25235 [Alphaproteobacteria bacterium]|nr:hypothetical protein [Alphaproteobacteria bacterium]
MAWAAPGDHVVAGHAVITPEVMAGVEIQSNAYRSEAPARTLPGYNFVGRVGLGVQLRAPKVWFDFDGKWEPRIFLTPASQNLNQLGNFAAGAALSVAPSGIVGFKLSDRARFSANSNDEPFKGNALVTQIRNTLAVGLPIRPGPEFTIEPGASWSFHTFRIPGAVGSRGYGDRNTIAPHLNFTWLFFPNTAFVFEASYEMNLWRQYEAGLQRPLPDSQYLRAVTGIRGRFTRHFLLQALVGYGFAMYQDALGGDFSLSNRNNASLLDSLIVYVRPELDFGYTDGESFGQRVHVSYRKDYNDSFFTNYLAYHQVGLGWDSNLGRFFGVQLAGSVRFEGYHGAVERNDIFPDVSLALPIRPTRYLTLRPAVEYMQRVSFDDPTVEYLNFVGRFHISFVY